MASHKLSKAEKEAIEREEIERIRLERIKFIKQFMEEENLESYEASYITHIYAAMRNAKELIFDKKNNIKKVE